MLPSRNTGTKPHATSDVNILLLRTRTATVSLIMTNRREHTGDWHRKEKGFVSDSLTTCLTFPICMYVCVSLLSSGSMPYPMTIYIIRVCVICATTVLTRSLGTPIQLEATVSIPILFLKQVTFRCCVCL